MPICHRLTTVTARAALAASAALASISPCSQNSTLDSTSAIPTSEIDQTVANDADESFDLTTGAVSGCQQ